MAPIRKNRKPERAHFCLITGFRYIHPPDRALSCLRWSRSGRTADELPHRLSPAPLRRGLLQHGMGVGSAEPERTDTGPPRPSGSVPCLEGGTDKEGTLLEVNVGIGFLEVQGGRISLCSSISIVLISPATPAAASRCPMLVLSDPIAQKPVLAVPLRKACVRASISIGSPIGVSRAVRLDVADVVRRNPSQGQSHRNDLGLTVHAGGREIPPAPRRRC